MKFTEELESRIKSLEQENQYLKTLLKEAGSPYAYGDVIKNDSRYDADQGARIIHREITEIDANFFFSMFWGRTDVYAKRTVKKATGEVNYYPQCYNFWKPGCPRVTGSKIKCRDCKKQAYKNLQKEQITAHLRGNAEDATDVIGIYPLLPDNTCRFLVFDFDNHDKDAEKHDFANVDEHWKEEVDTLRKICELNEIDVLVERSRSGQGAHLWIFFQKPIEAALARKFGNSLLQKGAETVNLKSFRYYDRMLLAQDSLPTGRLGNLIALPLQGQALKEGNSAFVDADWNAYHDQWKILLSKQKLTKEFVETKIKEWKLGHACIIAESAEIFGEENGTPWDKRNGFSKEDVGGVLHLILSDGIYIATDNLKPRLQNQIRRLAAFSNPVFYKNQTMGLSNFANARYIYLGSDEEGCIKIPRGLLETLTKQCDKAGIVYDIDDKRCTGRPIDVKFCGELKELQKTAVKK